MRERTRYSVLVAKSHCQQMRELLGDARLFDKRRRVEVEGDQARLPVVEQPSQQQSEAIRAVCSFSLVEARRGEKTTDKKTNDRERLLARLAVALPVPLEADLLQELPSCWEVYGDLLLLPSSALAGPHTAPHLPAILAALTAVFRVRRVARKLRVVADQFRSPHTELLIGTDGWVERKENGIIYRLDLTRSMFSVGNISEKLRVAGLDCKGETVLDLFAGIGYFTLPYLVHAGAERLVCCEWNPASCEALRLNLAAAGVADRATVLQGDCRLVAPHGVADRVNLGLLPSSELAWPTACRALRSKGGVLHVHGNAECERGWAGAGRAAWAEQTRESISRLLEQERGSSWNVALLHVETVKSYAPHVLHLVADLECRPPPPL